MEFYTLASSSAGNAALVCHENTHILIDAGISCRRITQSLAALSLTLDDLDGILITHEHIDHVRALGTLQKSTRSRSTQVLAPPRRSAIPRRICMPLPQTRPSPSRTCRSARSAPRTMQRKASATALRAATLARRADRHRLHHGRRARCSARSGHAAARVEPRCRHAQNGSYPYYLKQRILGECGHLSNEAAAEFAVECVRAGTSDILLAHLSDENNSPQLAEYTVGRALQASGLSVRLSAAPRDTISEVHVCRRSPSFASEN